MLDSYRLAYLYEAPVNWCPALGTVLANEEVTADGRSERGNLPVYRRPLKQWMLRITAYADRLLADLDLLDWPESIKLMQRNWIGRSSGAAVLFPVDGARRRRDRGVHHPARHAVRRHLHGARARAPARRGPHVPDHGPRTRRSSGAAGSADTPAEAVAAYQLATARRSDLERQAEGREKTGVFTGSFAINPVNGDPVPIFLADYVLMGYGTGAIMAVPAHDQRDFEFAQAFDLPLVEVVHPPAGWFAEQGLDPDAPIESWREAFVGDGTAVNSANNDVSLDGLPVADAKAAITAWLGVEGSGRVTVTYKLRDWLFSRQRYWGEPFPIVWDAQGNPHAVPEDLLPVELPEIDDFSPTTSDDEHSDPEPPLGRATDWVEVTLDLGDGPQTYRRETNTMPQWAGSCWYYLRYLDPTNESALVDPEVERYWMGPQTPGGSGGVDLYVGGVEHAVLHLLYARFWHKVLFDLGHVSSVEPFHRLFNQGYVQAVRLHRRARLLRAGGGRGEEPDGTFSLDGKPVQPRVRQDGQEPQELGHARRDVRRVRRRHAAAVRDVHRARSTRADRGTPVTSSGCYRLLQRIWRNVVDEDTGELRVTEDEADDDTQRMVHRTIAAAREGMESLRFNTVIAKLTELNNHLTQRFGADGPPRAAVEPLLLLLAPLAPHVAEELWSRLGHDESLAWADYPVADPAWLAEESVELPVQVNGKVRGHITVAPDADAATLEAAARADGRVAGHLDGHDVVKVIAVPGRMVNFVVR